MQIYVCGEPQSRCFGESLRFYWEGGNVGFWRVVLGELQSSSNYQQLVKVKRYLYINSICLFIVDFMKSCLLIVYFHYIVSSELRSLINCILIYDKMNLYKSLLNESSG